MLALGSEALEIGIDQHVDECLEVHARFPAEQLASSRGVADEVVELRASAHEGRIRRQVVGPVESNSPERDPGKLLDRMAHFRSYDVVAQLVLLEHQPHPRT